MLSERRAAARLRKLSSLEQEFGAWETDSGPRGDLRLHYSQIGRITGVLRPLQAQLAQPGAAPGVASTLTDREIESAALELHRIWEFFRSKFAMRKVRWLRTYLDAVDDFALACYKPARDAAERAGQIGAGTLKEPPLLFFGGGWSPFAMSRDFPFEAEAVPGEPLRTQAFQQALRKLPVPVVGLPWFQVSHLPDAVVIGHEVGHLVEDDFGMRAANEALIAGAAQPSRRPAWAAWAGEIFGDFYGQLATGPAFVSGLAEALSGDPGWIAGQTPRQGRWTDYPTTYLRMRFNFAMLRQLGFQAEAERLLAEWISVYGPVHAMGEFDADTTEIARALDEMTVAAFGGKRLRDVISFQGLRDEADLALQRLEAGAAPSAGSVRALVAASRLYFDAAPAAYGAQVQDVLLGAIAASLPQGTRGDLTETGEQPVDELLSLLAGRAVDV